jgi:Tol biopolymer transport system component
MGDVCSRLGQASIKPVKDPFRVAESDPMTGTHLWFRVRRRAAVTVTTVIAMLALGATIAPPAGADGIPSQIVRSRLGGSDRVLTDDGSAHVQPAWSPDGSSIAYAADSDGNYHLYVMRANGDNQTQLTSGAWTDTQPAWSPDGTRIAFASNRSGNYDIFTMNVDGSDVRQVTYNPAADVQPGWSPGGTRLSFASNRGGNWNVFSVGAGGTGLFQVTHDAAQDVQPAWSPTSGRIAFVSNRGGSLDVYTVGTGGRYLTRLTSSIAADTQPTWSPDGSTIAFSSNRTGYSKVYLVPAGGGTPQQVTDGATIDGQPSWKPSGPVLTFSQAQAPAPADISWGIYSAPRGGLTSDQMIAQLEGQVGRAFSGQRIYQNLTSAQIPTPEMEDLASRGGYIYLNINSFFVSSGHSVCARWGDVAAGRYDARWTTIAQQIQAFGYLIHLGFHHEMSNGSAHHPVCGTPADYVHAYDHNHELFAQLGVTNVRWVWAPTASSFIMRTAWRYMPTNFDIVGVDGYSRSHKWRTPSQIFVAAHEFAQAHGKPLLIGEVGCDEYPGLPTRKAQWLLSASNMFHAWTDLQAIMWTNTGAKSHRYWLDSSPQSLTIFRMAGVRFQ